MRMRNLMIASAAVCAVILLAGCGGSTTAALTGAGPSGDAASLAAAGQGPVITGIVTNSADDSHMAGVRVRLGGYEDTSDANGQFSVELPSGSTVASVCAAASGTFSLVLPTGSNWRASVISDGDTAYPVEWIPVPSDVLAGSATSMGTIALSPSADDGDTPPPPPTFEE